MGLESPSKVQFMPIKPSEKCKSFESETEGEIRKMNSNRDGGLFCTPLLGVGVEEDISASSLAVLVEDEADLTGPQLGGGPAAGHTHMNVRQNVAKLQHMQINFTFTQSHSSTRLHEPASGAIRKDGHTDS